jgi:hypothetical protein
MNYIFTSFSVIILLIILLIIFVLRKIKETFTSTSNIKFIHIGKCGGTSVNGFVKHIFNDYHLTRNYKQNEQYIIWIRNPLKRFVSAFYMSYNIINLDTTKLDINNLNINNCIAPMRVRIKIKNGNAFSKRYEYLINYFKNPNKLAESLTSKNENDKTLAIELMNNNTEHIYKGIGWYLYNGDFIKKNYNKILFVGSVENMDNDIRKLNKLLSTNINTNTKIRENKTNNDKYLSKKAIKNLLEFYKNTDYKALKVLKNFNFITNKLYKDYHKY